MKKLLLFVLACCLLLSCACAEEAQYPPVHISLWCETDESYEWTCEYSDNGVLSAPMEEFVEQETGGMHDFYFGVQSPGEAQIIFNYGVNWDVSVPKKTVICSVNVDETGESTVRWAESFADDHIILVMLPGNPTSGWAWAYQEDATGTVSLISEDYEPTDVYLEGAGGTSTYQLKVEKPGETVLMFNYSNLWDPAAPAEETYALIVTANENMEISLAVNEQ